MLPSLRTLVSLSPGQARVNGLLRHYFPKGTDLSRRSADDIYAVAAKLNSRLRKTPGWRTPAEALDEQLLALEKGGSRIA